LQTIPQQVNESNGDVTTVTKLGKGTIRLSWLSGRQTEGDVFGLNTSGQAVTIIKRDPKTKIGFVDGKSENYVLVVETIQAQSTHSVKDKLDHNVLRQHIVSLVIYFLRHPPCVDAQRRASLSIQVQADDFRIVKTGPVSKPLFEFRRPLDSADFYG
jgi:hypothetical protein